MITQETYILLEDNNPANRKKAIRQIGQSNEDSALTLLRNVIAHDVDETVRKYASQVEGFMTHQREFTFDDTVHETYEERDTLEKRAIYDAKFNDPPSDIEDTDPALVYRKRWKYKKCPHPPTPSFKG